VAEHLKNQERGRPWWEVYQPVAYKVGTRSGSEAEFADMVKRCNDVGIRVIVDVVLNHMTGDWNVSIGVGGTPASPAERDYPGVPYTIEHFNVECEANNYQDAANVTKIHVFGNGYENDTQKLATGRSETAKSPNCTTWTLLRSTSGTSRLSF
jgi:alpha-amylase